MAPVDPEIGFTSDVIRDPRRFVGRGDLIQDCIRSLNSPTGLIGIYGKRGVGKSSLLRQIQQMANGDYSLAKSANLSHMIPAKPRTYYTVYYACDAMINGAGGLASRLCNDQNPDDGFVRLVPDEGKELVEFSRSNQDSTALDIKLVKWGRQGTDTTKYGRVVPGDIIQTLRNFIESVVPHNNGFWRKRDGILILLDEFDMIGDKQGLGSLIKSISSNTVKFGICGIANDLTELVSDHASIERLLEEGAIHVQPMSSPEIRNIFRTAELLFHREGVEIKFDQRVVDKIADISDGYPYLAQLVGKACVNKCNQNLSTLIDEGVLSSVLDDIRSGTAFPTLERAYQRAIGNSESRQLLLTLLAEQRTDIANYNDEIQRVVLRDVRALAEDFRIDYVDQLLPRLVDKAYGPVLVRSGDRQGEYEFVNPILRIYVRLRRI